MSENEDESSAPSSERWMVSYADFMTLMFALFTVLYATSTRDLEKTQQFQESLKRFLVKAAALGGKADKLNDGERLNTPIEQPIQTYSQTTALSQDTFDEAEKYLEESLSEEERRKYVLDLSLDELGVRLVISGPAIFANEQAQFNEAALPFIDKVGDLIAKLKRRVMVEGHVARPPRNTQKYPSAWELAGARATNFVRYMILRHKLEGNLFSPVSYANERPVAAGKGPNDRLELVILTDGVPL